MTPPVFFTVPHDPLARGEVPGSTIRIVRVAARVALEGGHTADALRQRPNWHELSVAGAALRTAVRWGLIP